MYDNGNIKLLPHNEVVEVRSIVDAFLQEKEGGPIAFNCTQSRLHRTNRCIIKLGFPQSDWLEERP